MSVNGGSKKEGLGREHGMGTIARMETHTTPIGEKPTG
jgi:hypothetical protein